MQFGVLLENVQFGILATAKCLGGPDVRGHVVLGATACARGHTIWGAGGCCFASLTCGCRGVSSFGLVEVPLSEINGRVLACNLGGYSGG